MDSLPPRQDASDDMVFSGDVFLELAASGVLVLDPVHADSLVDDLRAALDVVRARILVNELFATQPRLPLGDLVPEVADAVADAAFAEQVAPGLMEMSLVELPK